ncbi:MAG: bifunctional demethylmenaquinone methyltransferase/2-methoxy-6-polyprenyl-1,4-benzoquinol methylase UbiE [Syntrophorhabdaceae bacterium]|nr:bifunctional demethylmenaquinone methyltransferase/2-methoxy-6-polyprenyl-1,4-benzoquinol methylase UbiE [Syntrophorhabdaceae bacterium]
MEKKKKRYPSVQNITHEEHIAIVREIFSTITDRYDFLNHFLSLRRDIAWRKFSVKKMKFENTGRLLDVACGTCDVAIYAASKYSKINVVCVDFVQEMLDLGKKKITEKGFHNRIDPVRADACALPFPEATFDVAAIAFGIRNIPDKKKALSEMARVVVPGGQVMILEMTFTRNWFSKILYKFYLNYMLPLLARRFSKNYGAYSYLADSIMNFPEPNEFKKMMEDAGMEHVKVYKLTWGITYLFLGIKKSYDNLG